MQRIRNFLLEDKEYFRSSQQEITIQNNNMLIDGCLVYAVVLLFYTIVTSVTTQPDILRQMYYVFDLIHFFLCIGVFTRSRQKKNDYMITQCFCILLELSILGFFALEGVYTSRTQHSLYIPIAILLILLLFIHKTIYTNIITFLYVVSFAVLSCLYKTPEAYINDLYIAVATFISANIGYVLIAKMRHREGAALCRYENLSKTDMLTGLLNKSAIESVCEQLLSENRHTCAFIILDLDNFKRVNDIYGHDIGDEVLTSVSGALRNSFRETDFIGRFGGDEFIVLMDNCREDTIIIERVERIIEQISSLHFSQEKLSVQCSVGITMKAETDNFQSIFKRADRALYAAKTEGKGRYRIIEKANINIK